MGSVPRVLNQRHDGRPRGAIYVGRPSAWGNPFRVGVDGARDEVVEKYRFWLRSQPDLLLRLHELRGRDLVCWCAPLGCHADVLLELANAPLRCEAADAPAR